MRVQFVYPNVIRHPTDISIVVGILSAILQEAGHETSLIDTTFGLNDTQILQAVRRYRPHLLAFSSMSFNYFYAKHIAKLIRREFDIPTILGGIHPTVTPEECIQEDCFDMICLKFRPKNMKKSLVPSGASLKS